MGIRVPNMIPADLVFIIEEELHRVYTRVGADLLVTKTISLVEALTGYTVKLVTLDGRNLTVPIDNVIHPEYEEIVENEGLPHHKDPTKKGNLRIRFKITFPPDLTLHQKVEMRKFLTDWNVRVDDSQSNNSCGSFLSKNASWISIILTGSSFYFKFEVFLGIKILFLYTACVVWFLVWGWVLVNPWSFELRIFLRERFKTFLDLLKMCMLRKKCLPLWLCIKCVDTFSV